jgi:hypothetical protein
VHPQLWQGSVSLQLIWSSEIVAALSTPCCC